MPLDCIIKCWTEIFKLCLIIYTDMTNQTVRIHKHAYNRNTFFCIIFVLYIVYILWIKLLRKWLLLAAHHGSPLKSSEFGSKIWSIQPISHAVIPPVRLTSWEESLFCRNRFYSWKVTTFIKQFWKQIYQVYG